MSNEFTNNNNLENCEKRIYGNASSLEKLQVNRNSKSTDVELSAELHSDLQSEDRNHLTALASEEFNPNDQQKPVSERTAWN